MAIDKDKAHELDNGVIVNDNGTEGPFYTGGPSSPVGLDLPVSTIYVQNGARTIIWQKFGAGVNNWRIYPAEDISFDPTGLDITSTNVQDAIASQVGRNYGKDFDQQTKVASETTSGGSFTTYDTLTFDVDDTSGTNLYRLNADFLWGHNATSNDIRVRVQLDGATVKELRIEPKDAGSDQRIQNNLLYYASNLSSGSHTWAVQYRPATASRTSRMYTSVLEAWRTE